MYIVSWWYYTLVIANNTRRLTMIQMCSFRLKGNRNAYDEVISGQAETLDILTFVKENMENG